MIQFEAWPKTPRWNRNIVITEKLDGTNAAVIIVDLGTDLPLVPASSEADPFVTVVNVGERWYAVGAQSRKRLICPGKSTDNYGFAGWVWENAVHLVTVLGAGRHFGEWWGQGIARGYGIEGKRFSLFNVHRYDFAAALAADLGLALEVVPVLYQGPNDQSQIDRCVVGLRNGGSWAAPGFDRPEGVIVFHSASGQVYKILLENDELPKGVAERLVAERDAGLRAVA